MRPALALATFLAAAGLAVAGACAAALALLWSRAASRARSAGPPGETAADAEPSQTGASWIDRAATLHAPGETT